MATRKTYRVICMTDLYHASVNSGFNKHTGIKVHETGLSLKEAQKSLLNLLNILLEDKGYCTVKRWGSTPDEDIRLGSYSDGTRSFAYDIFNYLIEEESDND